MEDKVKKSTTSRKPRATASKSTNANSIAPMKKTGRAKVTQMQASHDEIAHLAHRYWNERGRQHGHDAEDWFRAEQEPLRKAS